MRNLMKLIVITALAALLIFAMASCAAADEKLYTSPVFKLPTDRLEEAKEWAESQPETEPEEAEPEEEVPGEDEEEDEDAGEEVLDENGKPQRKVIIRSSQGEKVTVGEFIYLTSKLVGFDDVEVTYQWQVDTGDGAGWTDIEGATESTFMFVADHETVDYNWRLIVNVVE